MKNDGAVGNGADLDRSLRVGLFAAMGINARLIMDCIVDDGIHVDGGLHVDDNCDIAVRCFQLGRLSLTMFGSECCFCRCLKIAVNAGRAKMVSYS